MKQILERLLAECREVNPAVETVAYTEVFGSACISIKEPDKHDSYYYATIMTPDYKFFHVRGKTMTELLGKLEAHRKGE